ncbi:MAG: formylglycine-generating enzyme family protein [Flavobacteriales bacterium]
MKKACYLFLFLLLAGPVMGQIQKPKASSAPANKPKASAPSASIADVEILWEGPGLVKIKLGDQEFAVNSGTPKAVRLKAGDVEDLEVVSPSRTLTYEEFLMFDKGMNFLTIELIGERLDVKMLTQVQMDELKRKRAVEEQDKAKAEAKEQAKGDKLSREFTTKGMTFLKVAGGTFLMGCTSEQSNCGDNERPVHSVTLSGFYMMKYEVTQAQWNAVMGSNPSSHYGCDECPVEQVSWDDIQGFISKMNSMTGKRFRLPTEAEWEYAARGGNISKGSKYSGGSNLDGVAWYDGNSGSATHPVGQKQPNELGLYDMAGNVWEWCQDWHGDYDSAAQTNLSGASSGSIRVLRGGSWGGKADYCRVSYRGNRPPVNRGSGIGFRLVSPD